jgi:hypothetical protein
LTDGVSLTGIAALHENFISDVINVILNVIYVISNVIYVISNVSFASALVSNDYHVIENTEGDENKEDKN